MKTGEKNERQRREGKKMKDRRKREKNNENLHTTINISTQKGEFTY